MKKNIFLILMFTTYLFSDSFNVEDRMFKFSLPNQFDKMETVDKTITTIIVSFEKGTGADINEYLASKEFDFLQKHNATFIANISEMPAFVTKMFAMPKMQSYKHSILLIYSKVDKRFLQKEGKSTVYRLKNGVVQSVTYVESDEEINNIFN